MKTYLKDFSMAEGSLVTGCSELEEVISNRQEKFRYTAEYQAASEEIKAALKRLNDLSPGHSKAFGELEDYFFHMECTCYSAAYRDGMSDLMTAMTLNKLGITKVEYVDFSSKGA